MKLSAALIAAAAGLTSLTACEVRRGGEEAEPTPSPTSSETLSANGEPEREPASIIRPEASPEEVEDEPPEPLAATIPFPDGGYELNIAAQKVLRSLVASEQAAEGWPIVLRGHTDSEGNDQGNLYASRKRAEAVAGWLAENGIKDSRIEVIALGEQRPVAPNAHLDGTPNEEGRSQNRRVEVWVGPPGSEPGEGAWEDKEPREGA